MSLTAECNTQMAHVSAAKLDVERGFNIGKNVHDAYNLFAEAGGNADPQQAEAFFKTVSEAMLSLVRTDAIYEGQKRALERLRDELQAAGDGNMDTQQMQKRLRDLAKEEGDAAAVRSGANGAGLPAYKEYARAAGLSHDNDDDEVEMTQQALDPKDFLCPILKSKMVEPTKVTKCFEKGSTRCVFSKQGITSLVKRQGTACPVMGCMYTGAITLQDLLPCRETERKLKALERELKKQKLLRDDDTLDVDDDLLDDDEGEEI
ncbi:hypothetical protein T492DRAFT_1094213 [Pavlovales sp. CCMP2436]|nr:hypothetical protein T492DRAFT_1094213 [Pavlovales sp. CCMP2436]